MGKFILLLLVVLAVRLLLFYAFSPQIEQINRTPFHETTIFRQIKKRINRTYEQNLPTNQARLLIGIVFGEKDLGRSENDLFRKTGLLHVVAASGMNVSMLTSFLLATLLLFLKRRQALILTSLFIFFYTALADFQPSIVRAAIMATIALSAGVVGRQNTSIYALILTAFIMIFVDPKIISSISFILSFSSTLGIILIDPILKRGLLGGSFFEDLRTTLSAQIATTPILLVFFGSYSLISIPANFFVLWTIPPLMALGFVAAILSFILPAASSLVILVCQPLLAYFLGVASLLANYWFEYKTEDFPILLILGYYFTLLSIIQLIYKLKKIKA